MESVIKYELRDLTADDMFLMFNLINAIGIKEFKSCYNPDEIKQIAEQEKENGGANIEKIVGFSVIMDIASVLFSKLPTAKKEIYAFLAAISNLSAKEISALPPSVFMQMIIDTLKKDDFQDFFQVVYKLLK